MPGIQAAHIKIKYTTKIVAHVKADLKKVNFANVSQYFHDFSSDKKQAKLPGE